MSDCLGLYGVLLEYVSLCLNHRVDPFYWNILLKMPQCEI